MRLFFICLFVLACFPVLSQTVDTFKLDDVDIIGSMLDIRQKQTGRLLSIISSDQLKQSSAITLDEIIRFIPGIEIQSRNLYGVQADYSIRGSTFNQILVLIDGMRLNDPVTGHFSSYIPVPLSEIKRIEIIKGPAAVFYGPDAVGGVMNIVTNNSVHQNDSLLSVNVRTGYGQNELINSDAGLFKSNGKLNYSAGIKMVSSGGYRESDGHRNDFRLRSGTASFSFRPMKNFRLAFRTALDGREFGARRFYSISPEDNARENINSWWNHIQGLFYGTSSTSSLDLTMKYTHDNYSFNSLTPANNHIATQINAQLKNHREFSSLFTLVTGIQAHYRSIQSNDRGDHNEFTGGLYMLSFLNMKRNIDISGGLRFEFRSLSIPDILPHLNISYNPGNITFRALIGKTIRIPDFTELYVSTNLSSLAPGRNLGNPALVPEKSWSFEAGTEIKILPELLFETTAYNRFGYQLIDFIYTRGSEIVSTYPLDPDGLYFFADNIAELKTKGLEFIFKTHKDLGNKTNFNASIGYNIQGSKSSSDEISKYISNISPHLLIFQTGFMYKKFNCQIDGLYKKRNKEYAEAINFVLSPYYCLFNFKFAYHLIPDKLDIELRTDNIFNKKYSDITGVELPGRWISGGIKFKI